MAGAIAPAKALRRDQDQPGAKAPGQRPPGPAGAKRPPWAGRALAGGLWPPAGPDPSAALWQGRWPLPLQRGQRIRQMSGRDQETRPAFPRPVRGHGPARTRHASATQASARRACGTRRAGPGRWPRPDRAGSVQALLSFRSPTPCARHFSARRQSMGAVAGRSEPGAGRVAQTGATAFGVVLRAQARATGIGLRAAMGRQGCHPAHGFRRRRTGFRRRNHRKRARRAGPCPPSHGRQTSWNPVRWLRTARRAPRNANQRGKSFAPIRQCHRTAADPCLEQAATPWVRLFSGKWHRKVYVEPKGRLPPCRNSFAFTSSMS